MKWAVGVNGWAYRVPGGQGVDKQGPRESKGRHIGFQGVTKLAYRFPGGQGVGLEGFRGSRGRQTGSQGVKG